jgi:hypothetical protein
MDLTGLSSVFDLGKDLIDKLIPDPQAKAAAQIQLLTLNQQGEFKEMDNDLERMKTAMSAINTEGASANKWTSSARPAFLYVMYVILLFGLPLAFMSIWFPSQAHTVQTSFSAWVTGIPDSLMGLFGTGYLGYAGMRSFDKHSENKKQIELSK